MFMVKVRFLQTRVVQDQFAGTPNETRFEAGEEHELPEASALRWIQRGAAEAVKAPRKGAKEAPLLDAKSADPKSADPKSADPKSADPKAGEPAGKSAKA